MKIFFVCFWRGKKEKKEEFKKKKTLKTFQNLEILFTVQVTCNIFLKSINMKLEKKKTRKEKKSNIIFFKIAVYKNRAYKNCTALVSKNILLQNS